jgi:hypothetical protein
MAGLQRRTASDVEGSHLPATIDVTALPKGDFLECQVGNGVNPQQNSG